MPTRWAAGRGPETEHVRDQLSAYLDYELPELERDQVREHLRRCPECENELATLRATKQLVAEMPLQPAPRSFVLTPDMVGRPISGPVVVPQRGWSLAGRLRVAALGFAAILVVMLSSDYLFQGSAPHAAVSAPNFSTSASPYTAPNTGVNGTTANGLVAPAPTTTTAPAAAAATDTTSAPAAAAEATSTTAAAAAPAEVSTTAPAATGAGVSQVTAGDQAAPTVVAPPDGDHFVQQPGGPATGGAGQAPGPTPPPLQEFRTSAPPTAVAPLVAPAPTPPTGGLEIGGWRLVEGGLLLLVLALIGASLWAGRPRS